MWPGPSSDPGPGGDAPSQDLEDIKEQLGQQQTVIEQLKDTLRKNEEQRATNEKAAEEFASKLSGIKSRSKGLKRGARAAKQDVAVQEQAVQQQDPPVAVVEPEGDTTPKKEEEEKKTRTPGKSGHKSRHGDLTLLRRKLEENRMKLEQRSSVDSKQIEEKVEQLRLQLEERDQIIQDLQKGMEAAPARTPVKLKDTGQQQTEPPVPMDPQEMYAQMVYKDNKIIELNNRILQLEANVLDLQENVKEKDEVIDARTRAIALMSEEKEKKRKSTQDNLDDTREQMRLMQHNFISLETEMKHEKQELLKQLEAKDRRLHQLEESNQKLEGVRYELSTRIAELQTKVVSLQSQKVQAGAPEGARVEQLLKQLDDVNKQMIKSKAQHKNKVKQLNKQLDSFKKVSDPSEEILRLQQRVAELEEDKGNLQLHLVDFDELKAAEERWRKQVEELEGRVEQHNRDLSSLETEKLELLQGLTEERLHTSNLVAELERLRANMSELENLKVAAEMKAIELEEQLDILSREKLELQGENSELKQKLDVMMSEKQQSVLLSQEKDALQQQVEVLLRDKEELQRELSSHLLAEADSNRSFQMLSSKEGEEEKWKRVSMSDEPPAEKHIKDSSNHELSLKLLEAELDDMRKTLAQQKDIIADLSSKLQSREEDIEMQQEVISKLEQLGQEVGVRERNDEDANKISEILKDVNEMAGDLEEWKTRCTEVEDRLKVLEDEKRGLEQRLEDVTNENSTLSTQLRIQKEVSEDAVSKVNEQTKLLGEQNMRISELENILEDHKQILVLKETEISDLRQACSQVTPNVDTAQVQDLSKDLDLTRAVLQAKTDELASIKQELEEKLAELAAKNEALEKAEEKLKERTDKMKKLAANLKAKAIVVRGHEERETNFKSSLEQKEKIISELTAENQRYCDELNSLRMEAEEKAKALEAISEKFVVQETTLRSEESRVEGLTEHIRQLSDKIQSTEEEINSLKEEKVSIEKLAEEHESALRNQVTELEREISILQMDLRNKSDEIALLKEEAEKGVNAQNESKLAELSWKVEELTQLLADKDVQLGMIDFKVKDLIVSKDMQLSALQDQLSGVTERYQQSWSALEAKMQEREAFIESLEQELARVREHEQHLEEGLSNLEERRRSLESKYEALGVRLLESDRIKEEVEEHEDILEERLTSLITNEETLRKKLGLLEENNSELALRISTLTEEKEDLKRGQVELVNSLENSLTNANTEIERLLMFEVEYNQLLEKLQFMEAEKKHLATEFERSEREKLQLIESLELDLKNVSSQVQQLEEEKHALMEHCEKLNDLKCNLEEELESVREKSEATIAELQKQLSHKQLEIENLCQEKASSIPVNFSDLGGKVDELSCQVSDLTECLAQKESEIQSYQSRLLQMHFGGASSSDNIISEVELSYKEKVSQLEDLLSQRDSQLEELALSRQRIEELSTEVRDLREKVSSTSKYEDLFMELVREKASTEVNSVISVALNRIQQMQSAKVSFQVGDSSSDRELEGKFSELNSKLEAISEERDEAISRIEEFTKEYVRSQELESTLGDLRSERDALKSRIDQLSSEQAYLQEMSLELESVRGERDILVVRAEELTGELMERETEYRKLQENYDTALARLESLGEGLATKPIYSSPDLFSESCEAGEEMLRSSSMPVCMASHVIELQDEEEVGASEDAWGWGSEEARLEEEHLQKQQQAVQIIPGPSDELKLQIMELDAKVNELQEEKEKLVEELRVSQVRCGKLLTKLKDFKLKNENLMRENQALAVKKNDFGDLDSAIEEELKIRIDSLEKELKERDALRSEKETLVKRIDTLTAANERLVEMKEHQDLDLDMWQRKNKDLLNQIEALHWKLGEMAEAGSAGDHAETSRGWDDAPQTVANSDELQEQLSALASDNEHLQEILEEQRNMRLAAEASLKEDKQTISSLQAEVSALKEENIMLRQQYEAVWQELQSKSVAGMTLQDEEIINTLRAEITALRAEKSSVCDLDPRTNRGEQEEGIVDALRAENTQLREQYEAVVQDLQSKCVAGTTLQDEEIINTLRAEITALRTEITILRDEKSTLEEKYESAKYDLDQKTSSEEQEKGILDALRAENSKLQEQYEAVMQELQSKSMSGTTLQDEEIINALRAEITALRTEKSTLEEKFESAVCDLNQRTSPEDQARLLKQEEGIVDALRAENAKLREQYEAVLQDLERKFSPSEEQVDVQEGIVDVLRVECATLRERCEAAYREMELLRTSKGASDTLQANYDYLQFAHERLGMEMNALQESYRGLESDYEKSRTDLEISLQGNDTIKRELEELQKQHSSLVSEFQALTGKYEESIVRAERSEQQTATQAAATMTEDFCEQIEEKQRMIAELSDDLKKKTAEMDVLRDMITTEQQERADTENELNYMISSLQSELERSRQSHQKESDDREELIRKEEEISQLTSQLASHQEIVNRMNDEIGQLSAQLLDREQQVLASQEQEALLQKEQEIQNLEMKLAEKERIVTVQDDDIGKLKSQILEREQQFDELMFVKDEDIQNLRIQYTELERRTRENLDLKDRDLYNLQLLLTEKDKKIYQLSQVLEEETKQVSDLQELLDKREEELKVLIRTKEAPGRPLETTEASELDGMEPEQEQSELDLALYMLHQRDVRCDELTLELMQLLEERDTLQLRLSSALRINEELRSKLNKATSTSSSPVRVPVTLVTSSSSESSRATEGSGESYDQVLVPIEPQPITQQLVGEEPKEDLQELASKLSQLHRLDYRRDVTVHDETQQRHSEQMQLLQQRGAGIVVESNYTLSRDVQSPSTVLLNWIWGRSTPRVMHI